MVENPYFQFPLCALCFAATPQIRINSIIEYATITAGLKWWDTATTECRREFIDSQIPRSKPRGFNKTQPLHWAALYGAHALGIVIHDIASAINSYDTMKRHIAHFQARHGRDPLVRIKKDWVFRARDSGGITYREFSVLCAIYSAIGNKEMAIVTRNSIRRRALGYRKAAIMESELASRPDKAQPLTPRQLRDTIGRLHRNKFFARSTVARRITYYSIRLDSEALRKKILDRRTYAEFFRISQSAQDEALTAAIKQKRRDNAQPKATILSLPPQLPKSPPSTA